MSCLNCKKEVSDRAKYCSDRCRMAFSRVNKLQPEQKSEQKEPEQLTRTTITGMCHGCGEQQESSSVCICHQCIAKEVTHKGLGLEMCIV
jgi:hypothetical protein